MATARRPGRQRRRPSSLSRLRAVIGWWGGAGSGCPERGRVGCHGGGGGGCRGSGPLPGVRAGLLPGGSVRGALPVAHVPQRGLCGLRHPGAHPPAAGLPFQVGRAALCTCSEGEGSLLAGRFGFETRSFPVALALCTCSEALRVCPLEPPLQSGYK